MVIIPTEYSDITIDQNKQKQTNGHHKVAAIFFE